MMSAGSPRRSRSQTRTTPGCVTVSPQHVTDPTILDSVAGFINEVATYNVPPDTKDQIQWAKFEQMDCDAVLENLNGDKIVPSALLLVLGYSTGIQVWTIPGNGEAAELLSWRHGSVRVLRFLPSPYIVGRGSLPDIYASKRPLVAVCDTTTPGPHYCALSFLSLKTGEQVKVIKFKNPILDVLANRRSVVVTFAERIAVFDAFTLEDRLTVTTCYLSPGIYPNPVALGARWMAYAEKKLISNKRSSGGNEGEGVQSYTATVLHAAKSLGKGLRELGETVASSLTGNPSFKPGTSPGSSQTMGSGPSESLQKGVVTILDIENQVMDDKPHQTEGVIAHFAAHSEAIVCLAFDPSGLLLLTADKRGHDFHLFRIHPHPGGPALAAVHHLYILHRGDTTARVQDMCFSPDSRWVSVSTLRGTTHVFPVTPYGGNVGVRTHATPHVVNRMSRFHRSAGLPVEGRSNSPVSLFEAPVNSNLPYNNPRLPPYPHPTIVHPLAQIRQPLFIQAGGNSQQRPHGGRPRLNSSSEENIQVALRLCCCFAPARAWFDNVTQTHDTSLTKQQAKPVESLFIMSCHGPLLQYDLEPHHVTSVPKEKVCDETPIELTVHAKAQWMLQRQQHLNDAPLPVPPQNLNLLPQDVPMYKSTKPSHMDDRWLSQVEIVTHAGPHRRLWMGPQFTFKTYTTTNGSPVSLTEAQTIDVGRSKPVNMPVSTTYPILIESGSASSCEQSPKLLDTYQRLSEEVGGAGELQLKEDLADAMLESPGVRDSGGRCVIVSMKPHTTSVAKVVNPLGTVVTIHSDDDAEVEVPEDAVIHENCDEALFRPVVAPKPLLFANKSRILLTNRTSIAETAARSKPVEKVKEDLENGRRVKPKAREIDVSVDYGKGKGVEEPRTKVQSKNNKSESKYQSKSEIKIDLAPPRVDVGVKIVEAPKVAERAKVIEKSARDIEKASKIVEKTRDIEKTLKDIEKTTKDIEKAPKIIERTPREIEKASKDFEKASRIIEKTPRDVEKFRDIEKASKGVEKASKIIEKTYSRDVEKSKDTEKTSRDVEKYRDIEKTSKDIEKTSKIIEKTYSRDVEKSKDIEKTSKDFEKASKIIEKTRDVEKSKDIEKTSRDIEKAPKIIEKTPTRDVEKSKDNEKASKDFEKASKIIEKTSRDVEKSKDIEKPSPDIEKPPKDTEKTLKDIEKIPKVTERTPKFIEKPRIVEKAPKIVEPPLKITESAPKVTSEKISRNFDDAISKIIEPTATSKKSKTKSKAYAFIDRDNSDSEKSTLSMQEISKQMSEMSTKISLNLSHVCANNDDDLNLDKPTFKLKNLITTPDLIDSEDAFDFPLPPPVVKSKTKDKTRVENLPPPILAKNEDSLKEETFEDARDTAEMSESLYKIDMQHKETKTYKSGKYQGLEPDEIVFSSEEEKSSTNKKPRKPKAKLGVRLSKEKTERESDGSVEVTLPAPRKSWSSIVSSKPAEREFEPEEIKEAQRPIIDLPDVESVEHFTVELPKKSYSTVAKQHLFEIDPHEDVCESGILLPEKIYKSSVTTRTLEDFNLLKIDPKSSDDEKQENGSSQTETTESDDSSKVIAMDTEEDSCQPEVTKSTRQGGEQAAECIYRDAEDLSSTSSFSSASRASPSPSYSGENLLHFPGDSSSSL